jgi:hypothetical protein
MGHQHALFGGECGVTPHCFGMESGELRASVAFISCRSRPLGQ